MNLVMILAYDFFRAVNPTFDVEKPHNQPGQWNLAEFEAYFKKPPNSRNVVSTLGKSYFLRFYSIAGRETVVCQQSLLENRVSCRTPREVRQPRGRLNCVSFCQRMSREDQTIQRYGK